MLELPMIRIQKLLVRPDMRWTLSQWIPRVLLLQSYVANCVLGNLSKSRLWR